MDGRMIIPLMTGIHFINHDYVITLDEMPVWENYEVFTKPIVKRSPLNKDISVKITNGLLCLDTKNRKVQTVSLYTLNGTHLSTLENPPQEVSFVSILKPCLME